MLLFDAPDPRDGAIAAIVNFACHATVLFSTNMQISADYPGYAVRTVQRIIGDVPVLFLNGACGDVNPAWIEQRYDEAARVGNRRRCGAEQYGWSPYLRSSEAVELVPFVLCSLSVSLRRSTNPRFAPAALDLIAIQSRS